MQIFEFEDWFEHKIVKNPVENKQQIREENHSFWNEKNEMFTHDF